jgi:hypothetical protein
MSAAETALAWQMKAAGLPRPTFEFRFSQGRRWRFDVAWPERSIAVEVEGGSYVAGRHTRPAGFEADCEKYNEAVALGWRVLRVTPHMIDDGRALAIIERVLA